MMAFGAAGVKMDEEYFLKQIENHIPLTEEELRTLVLFYSIEEMYGADHRWHKEVTSIVRLGNRYFAVEWYQGLTELQDNEFFDQPYEVEFKEYEKTITIKEWVKKTS